MVMIPYEQAQNLHTALQYERCLEPGHVLKGTLETLPLLLGKAIAILSPELIVLSWEATQSLARRWGEDSRIKSVRDTSAWIWGSRLIFDSVPVFSSPLVMPDYAQVFAVSELRGEVRAQDYLRINLQ